MTLVSQFGREICLQHRIILMKVSMFGANDSIIVSYKSGRRNTAGSLFCPAPIVKQDVKILEITTFPSSKNKKKEVAARECLIFFT